MNSKENVSVSVIVPVYNGAATLPELVALPRPPLAPPPEPYDGMPVSEADYWEFYYLGPEVTYEWNDGILEEKGGSDYLTFRVFDWFIQLLSEFLRARPLADRVGLEMGFRLALPDQVAICCLDWKHGMFTK